MFACKHANISVSYRRYRYGHEHGHGHGPKHKEPKYFSSSLIDIKEKLNHSTKCPINYCDSYMYTSVYI